MVCETKLHTWPFFNVLNGQTNDQTWLLRLNLQTKLLTTVMYTFTSYFRSAFRIPFLAFTSQFYAEVRFLMNSSSCSNKCQSTIFMGCLFLLEIVLDYCFHNINWQCALRWIHSLIFRDEFLALDWIMCFITVYQCVSVCTCDIFLP